MVGLLRGVGVTVMVGWIIAAFAIGVVVGFVIAVGSEGYGP